MTSRAAASWCIALFPGAIALAFASSCVTRSDPPPRVQYQQAITPPTRLEAPQYLPQTARALLKSRMGRHAMQMGALMDGVLLLKYPAIIENARAIAEDASLARPLSDDATELNAQLPARFFDLQDQVRHQAKELAAAAERERAFEIAEAYGKLSQTCVECHVAYRDGPAPVAAPPAPAR